MVPIQRVACPAEYLCPLCKEMYDNPCIARCCGRSACFNCFEVQLDETRCPLCSKLVTNETTPIPNRILFDTVASLNLDYFDLPGGKVPQSVKGPEVVDLDSEPEEQPAAPGAPSPQAAPAAATFTVTPGPGLPPPELLARAWSGDLLPVPPCSPPPFPTAGPPGMQACMLSAEQFHSWQQSLQNDSGSESSSSSARRRKKKRKKEKKEKRRKGQIAPAAEVAVPPVAAAEPEVKAHRKAKRRRKTEDDKFQ